MADLFYSKQKAKTNRVGLAPTHPGNKKAVDPYRYLKYAALAYLIYAVLKYVGVADEMNGSGPANGIFSLFDGRFYPGVSESVSSGIPFMNLGGDAGFGEHFLATLLELAAHPLRLHGIVLSHTVLPFLLVFAGIWIVKTLWHLNREINHQDIAGGEGGTASFMDAEDLREFQKNFTTPHAEGSILPDQNICLGDGVFLATDTHKTKLNLNTLTIGGSGTGKTRGFILPNIAQMNSSFVVTDPAGEVLACTGKMLLEHGYRVKIFSTADMLHSNVYNPMDYIYDQNGEPDDAKANILVSTFIKNAEQSSKKSGGDPFWVKSETALMKALVLYLAECCPIEERNMNSVLKLTQLGRVEENVKGASVQTELDKKLEKAAMENPKAKFLSSYKTFKLAPAKTANSILITLAADLDPFSTDTVKNMTTTDYLCVRNAKGLIKKYIGGSTPIRSRENIDLEYIGDEKTALFINTSQTNSAYNFLNSMLYSQLFETLYTRAMKVSPNRFHIYDRFGQVLSSQYKTKEEAEHWLELFAGSHVEELNGRFYIYNEKATKQETLPEITAMSTRLHPLCGYIKEVYSRETGERLIASYQGKIQKSGMPQTEEETKQGFPFHAPKEKEATLVKDAEPVSDKPYVKQGDGHLPIPVQVLLDEFANIGEIPDFDNALSTMRKYWISCAIILQSLTQIKAKYDKIWEVLVGNCDSIIFLGSSENETDKYISEKLGKATIRTMDASISKGGNSGSQSTSYKKQARDLLDQAEVGKISNDDCIICIRGQKPIYTKKIQWGSCEHYKETGDSDPGNRLGEDYLEKYYSCSCKATAKEEELLLSEYAQKDAVQKGDGPSGTHGTGKPPKPVRNGKEIEEAVGSSTDEEKKATRAEDSDLAKNKYGRKGKTVRQSQNQETKETPKETTPNDPAAIISSLNQFRPQEENVPDEAPPSSMPQVNEPTPEPEAAAAPPEEADDAWAAMESDVKRNQNSRSGRYNRKRNSGTKKTDPKQPQEKQHPEPKHMDIQDVQNPEMRLPFTNVDEADTDDNSPGGSHFSDEELGIL